MEERKKEFYTCKEVAERYGVKTTTVWNWCRTGKLEAIRIGKSYRIREEAFAVFEQVTQDNQTT